MTQSRTMSAIESVANVAVGYGVSVIANLLVLPAFGYAVTLGDSLVIGLVFTFIALIRQYCVRRIFNVL